MQAQGIRQQTRIVQLNIVKRTQNAFDSMRNQFACISSFPLNTRE